MRFSRRFTADGRDPFDSVEYETRKSGSPSSGRGGESLEVEVPRTWSQTATDILAQKYLRRRDVPGAGRETSVRQVVDRLAGCWRHWGRELGYFDGEADAEAFYAEAVYMLLHQMAAPNSPQWFNTGLNWKYGIRGKAQGHWYVDPEAGEIKEAKDAYSRPQPHACFIQSVGDDLLGEDGIYELLAKEGRIFKYGSGSGTNFSAIRAAGEPLRGGGRSSGLMSFLKVFDRAAGAIKSGGTTRRAAKMVCLDLDHPEIEDFILWKSREEAKVAALAAGSRLLRRAGRPDAEKEDAGDLVPEAWKQRAADLRKQGLEPLPIPELDTGYEGEAYATVSGQNSNNSVRIPNRFLAAVEAASEWELTARTDGSVLRKVPARRLWDLVGLAAWECADPGVQFGDTINEWHTCPGDGPIRASNPCSEYMFLDDTACNLASLNLVRFQDADGSLRIEDFRHAVRIWTVVLDISVGMAQFPSAAVARRSYDYRTLGLGYANLGAFLMRAGIPYDSPEAVSRAAAITALMGGAAYAASAEMASCLGAFPRFDANRDEMLRVIRNHARAALGEGTDLGPYQGLTVAPPPFRASAAFPSEAEAAREAWNTALTAGETFGFRNAQVTVLAPTGTIGLLMDCDTTGIEPDFALVKFKKLSGGGFLKIVNQSVPEALRRLGYSREESRAMTAWCLGSGTLDGAPAVNPATLAAAGFPTAAIAAAEKALAGALSLSDAFAPYVVGAEAARALGLDPAASGTDVLARLGFGPEAIEAADLAVCGAQTLEGAPHLRPEHLAVFDCASRCGRGTRSIAPAAHLRIMAAAQPFLSGAISKTVNLPADATVADIQGVYREAWGMMLKAVAVYRDGCKLSQPLTAKRVTPEKASAPKTAPASSTAAAAAPIRPPLTQVAVIASAGGRPMRRKLPARRGGYVQEVVVSGHKLFLRTGEYPDGTLGEIFIDMYKEGAAYRGILNCFAVLASKALQYGVPLEELVDTFTFTRFEPAGPVDGHENIRNCTSILDLIFRILGLSYLGQTDFVHVKPAAAKEEAKTPGAAPAEAGPSSGAVAAPEAPAALNGCAGVPAAKGMEAVAIDVPVDPPVGPAEAMHRAPAWDARKAGYAGESCSSCGSVRVRRNGTCVVCEDCGTTSGCS